MYLWCEVICIADTAAASGASNPLNLTPASITPESSRPSVEVITLLLVGLCNHLSTILYQIPIPRARGVASTQDIEVFERERGNEEFKSGNFTAAVKCYTKCLGLKVNHSCAVTGVRTHFFLV